jgi:hypothetical protein
VHCESRVAVAITRGQVRNPGRRKYAIGNPYQRNGEERADQEDSVRTVANCR